MEIFDNKKELSKIQLVFLQWIRIYKNLYEELYLKEEGLTEEMVEDDVFCDAYLYWRKIKRNQKKEEDEEQKPKSVFIKGTKIPSKITFVPLNKLKRGSKK